MKQVVLRIDDAAFERFMGMVSLCPQVEVLNVCQTGDKKQTIDAYVATAIREMRQRLAFRYSCDYAYLMVAMNESVVKGLPFFYTPKDFIEYMREAEFDHLPGRSTVYNTIAKVRGRYPDWTFTDAPKASEVFECFYEGPNGKVGRFAGRFLRGLDDSLDDRKKRHRGLQNPFYFCSRNQQNEFFKTKKKNEV